MRLLVLLYCGLALSATALAQSSSATVYAGTLNTGPGINPQTIPVVVSSRGRAPTADAGYLFAEWTLGKLCPYTGPPTWAWVKYNVLDRQLISGTVLNNTVIIKRMDIGVLREITLGDSARGLAITLRRYLNLRMTQPSLRTALFEVHYDCGKTALICQRFAASSGGVLRYYLKGKDNLLTLIHLNPKSVLATLGSNQAGELTAYAAQQQLNLTRETDVVRLLVFYDAKLW